MLADPTDQSTVARELGRTYNTPGYSDPWECVQDYRRVQRYSAEHPRKGSQAVSTALNLPRERIRGWVDSDTRPDCVHAIETAERNGWLIDTWDSPEATALNRLSAWLLSSGSISRDPYRPRWIADGYAADLRETARDANIPLREEEPRGDRPPEWVPDEDSVVLGRLLHLWTGLEGDKSQQQTRFPRYLRHAPTWVARDFLQVYVRHRAHERRDTEGYRIQVNEHRSDEYRGELVKQLRRVVLTPNDIRGDSYPIYIIGDAAAELTGVETEAPSH